MRRIARMIRSVRDDLEALNELQAVQFSTFRRYLAGAGGIQSSQFRQIEASLGVLNKKQPSAINFIHKLPHYARGSVKAHEQWQFG